MLSTNKLAVLAFATFVALQAPAYADDAVIATVGTTEIRSRNSTLRSPISTPAGAASR